MFFYIILTKTTKKFLKARKHFLYAYIQIFLYATMCISFSLLFVYLIIFYVVLVLDNRASFRSILFFRQPFRYNLRARKSVLKRIFGSLSTVSVVCSCRNFFSSGLQIYGLTVVL